MELADLISDLFEWPRAVALGCRYTPGFGSVKGTVMELAQASDMRTVCVASRMEGLIEEQWQFLDVFYYEDSDDWDPHHDDWMCLLYGHGVSAGMC